MSPWSWVPAAHTIRWMEINYTLTKYDPDRPLVVIDTEDRTVDLGSADDFYRWAAETWQAPRWTAELHLDPA